MGTSILTTEIDWPEDRVDIIGQNGNDGLHYSNLKTDTVEENVLRQTDENKEKTSSDSRQDQESKES